MALDPFCVLRSRAFMHEDTRFSALINQRQHSLPCRSLRVRAVAYIGMLAEEQEQIAVIALGERRSAEAGR